MAGVKAVKTSIQVRRISPQQAWPLRHAVLRPWQSLDAVRFHKDDDPLSAHFGAFADHALVGVTSILPQSPPHAEVAGAWQLQGVAVLEELRGTGCGSALIEACLDYAISQAGRLVWANGRTTALGFYNALGFHAIGDEYVTVSGPHYLVLREL